MGNVTLSQLPAKYQALAGGRPKAKRSPASGAAAVEALPAMNKWEAEHARRLATLRTAGEVLWFEFAPVRLVLGPKLAYTPDFLVQWADGSIGFDEVKGYEREDAVAKFKMAAGKFPLFRFRMLTFRRGAWVVTREYAPRRPQPSQPRKQRRA